MPSITTYVHRDAVDEAEQFLKGATALVSSLERALRQGLEITAGSRIKRLRHLGTTSERRIRINKVRSVYSHVTHADGRSLVFVHSVSPRGEAYSRDAFRSRVDGFHSQVWDRVDRVFRIDLSDSVYSEIPYVEPADEHYDSIVLEPYLTDQQYEYSSFLLPLGEHPIHGDPFLILGHGPPGSGKTVVLQQAAVRAWEEQTSVLILVPSNRLVSEYQEALGVYGIKPARFSEIARGRIVEIGLRYVGFGVQNSDLYRVLFSHRLARPLEFYDEMFQAGEIPHSSSEAYSRPAAVKMTAFEALVRPIAEAQEARIVRTGDPQDFGLALAAMLHGLVGEFIDEGLGGRQSAEETWSDTRQGMSRRVLELLMKGVEAKADLHVE